MYTITASWSSARYIFFFFWLTKAESVAIVDISGASRFMTNRELALGKIMCCMCLPILVPCLARPNMMRLTFVTGTMLLILQHIKSYSLALTLS